jgi:hypothetical protein
MTDQMPAIFFGHGNPAPGSPELALHVKYLFSPVIAVG